VVLDQTWWGLWQLLRGRPPELRRKLVEWVKLVIGFANFDPSLSGKTCELAGLVPVSHTPGVPDSYPELSYTEIGDRTPTLADVLRHNIGPDEFSSFKILSRSYTDLPGHDVRL
jgi:hypothetical protein